MRKSYHLAESSVLFPLNQAESPFNWSVETSCLLTQIVKSPELEILLIYAIVQRLIEPSVQCEQISWRRFGWLLYKWKEESVTHWFLMYYSWARCASSTNFIFIPETFRFQVPGFSPAVRHNRNESILFEFFADAYENSASSTALEEKLCYGCSFLSEILAGLKERKASETFVGVGERLE